MNEKVTVDVVVVNWNSGEQLLACVKSVLTFGEGVVDRIIVVDNNSSDGSERGMVDLPNVKLVYASSNLGFGKACNLGASYTRSKFILFLNPDATVFPSTLGKAVGFMQSPESSSVGICGVQLLDGAGRISRSCARFPSLFGFVFHAMGVVRLFPSWGHSMSEWDHSQTREVDQVIGAFFLVRREVFVLLDGFDDRFFVYFEEVDFSIRARNIGWHSVYLADTQAFHAGGGTSNQVKALRLFYSLRSRLQYVFKHFSFRSAVLVLMATLFIEPFSRLVQALLRGSLSGLKETWSAYVMLLRWLPRWFFTGVKR